MSFTPHLLPGCVAGVLFVLSAPALAGETAASGADAASGEARAAQPESAEPVPIPETTDSATMPTNQIVVTASRVNLLGSASTTSQGSITAKEIELRPVYRPSQLYESIPGM